MAKKSAKDEIKINGLDLINGAKNPNCQNMPRAGADDIGVRNFITAPKGKILLSLDFSQVELPVGTFYCKDEKMRLADKQ